MKHSAYTFPLFACLLQACAVTANLPLTRFESPEANGKWAGAEGQVAYQARSEVELSPNFTDTAPTLTNPSVEVPNHRLMAEGSFGLLERLDANLTLPHTRFGLKYQVLGSPRTTAEPGNFPVALSAGISRGKDTVSGTRLFSSERYNYELKETEVDFAIIAGWRFSPQFLLYGGPHLVFSQLRLSDQSPSPRAASAEGEVRSLGVNLGGQISANQAFFRLEIAGAKVRLGNADVGRASFGASMGITL